MQRLARLLTVLILFLAIGHPAAAQAPVTVFAAASLQNVLEEAGKIYSAKTGKSVRFSFAASSAIAR